MFDRRRIPALLLALLCTPLVVRANTPAEEPIPDKIRFNRDVRPIFSDTCFKCHGFDAKARKADLRLDTKEALTQKHKDFIPVVPGDPSKSEIYRRIVTTDQDDLMPPPRSGKKFTPRQKEIVKRWIEQGMDWEPHWAFTKVERPQVPAVKDAGWVRNPVDAFILARLEKEGLKPSPEADKVTLIRRVTLDLTGLPATPAEVDAFVADSSPAAYEKLVDRLLASPRYGERMALDWLDAARFADTNGYHIDTGRDMTKWREYVIHAYNANKPFDVFTTEQLAGDLLPNASLEQKIASGFNRNHMINFEGGAIPEEYHTAYLLDRTNTTGTVWLGLTVACTQCHDHKYDPITQKDYYSLLAFFNNIPENGLDGRYGNAVPMIQVPSPEQSTRLKELDAAVKGAEQAIAAAKPAVEAAEVDWEREVAAADDKAKKDLPPTVKAILTVAPEKRNDKQREELRNHYVEHVSPISRPLQQALDAAKKARDEFNSKIPTAMVMQEMAKPRETHVLIRGQYDQKGELVSMNTPAFLPPMDPSWPKNRLGLAEWLLDEKNPLTSRVTVNRFWQSFFGTGIVKTSGDFGSQGELPSHPELLDWLASEFMHPSSLSGKAWDIKAMVKLMVTSSTYRQSSTVSPDLLERDPENRLLARGPRFRLNAEFIRDQALAVAGLLDNRIGGASVSPYQPAGLWEELMSRADGANFTAQVYVQSHGPDLYRRSMYTFWKRTVPPPQLAAFDAPDRESCTVKRSRTITPLQALVLMNDPTYVEASRKLAERVMREGGSTVDDRITYAFRLPLARKPRPDESAVLKRIFTEQLAHFTEHPDAIKKLLSVGESPRDEKLDQTKLAAWTTVASVILNLDETVTKG
jgi:hypothetical protein